MGTFLKVIGALTVLGWIVMGAGCTMLSHAISQGAGSQGAGSQGGGSQGVGRVAYGPANDRSAIVRAMQAGEIDTASLPSDIAGSNEVTLTLRDGTRRTLGSAPEDRIVRAMLAARADGELDSPYRSSGSYSSRGGSAADPHFKPGEPMVNPSPGSSYDD